MSYRSMLRQRCTIERWSAREPDSNGEPTATYRIKETGVRILVQDHAPRSMTDERGITVKFRATGYVLSGTDLRPTVNQDKPDRVCITKNGCGTYKVLGVLDTSGQSRGLEIALEAV